MHVKGGEVGRLVGFLSNIRALIQLEDVYIVVAAEFVVTDHRGPRIDWTVWAELDDLLTTSDLNHLRLVTFDVDVDECWCGDLVPEAPLATNEVACFEATFPKLAHRGVLQVNEVDLMEWI